MKEYIFLGFSDQIAKQLVEAAKNKPYAADALMWEAGYFKINHERKQYLEMREEGYPVDNGMMECRLMIAANPFNYRSGPFNAICPMAFNSPPN